MTTSHESYPQLPFRLPDGATEILLVRHGASQAHVPGQRFDVIAGGHSDPPLSPTGHRQAALLCARLLKEQIATVFITPLRRTQQTAMPLLKAAELEPIVIDELREVHLGDWEGGEIRVRAAAGDPLFAQLFARQRWDVIPGAEPADSFGARVRVGIERIVAVIDERAAAGLKRRAIAVLHGGVIAEICHQAIGGGPRLAFAQVENTSVSSLVIHADGRHQLRSYNCTTHLL